MIEDDAHLERAMRAGHPAHGLPQRGRVPAPGAQGAVQPGGSPTGLTWRGATPECAFLGTRRLMALARRTGRATHILHVSTAEELAYLRDFRDVATVEVLVNHLTQVAPECYDTLGGLGVMNPPIRDARHRAAAWAALRDGTVDNGRQRPRAPRAGGGQGAALPGLPGRPHRGPDPGAGDARSRGGGAIVPRPPRRPDGGRAARVYGLLGKGRIAAGYDADFTWWT